MAFSNDRLSAFNLGDLDLRTPEVCADPDLPRAHRYRDARQMLLGTGEVWIFDYGAVVFWGVTEEEQGQFLSRLHIRDREIEGTREEHFRFGSGPEVRISRDTITLVDDDPLSRLAVSHALAQSLKLTEYEWRAQRTIQDHSALPEELATTGKIRLGRRQIAKIRGRLFSTKSDIILHYSLLDTPEFFWEYPEYESTYNVAARYLEIHPRVDLLSRKLETIHELFGMLADEQKHQHSAFLEWIIIILIAVEILMVVGQEVGDFISRHAHSLP